MSSRAAGDWSRNDAVTQWEAAYVERDANLFWPVALNHREKEGGETSIMPLGWHAARMAHIQPTRGDIYHSEEAGLVCADSGLKKKRKKRKKEYILVFQSTLFFKLGRNEYGVVSTCLNFSLGSLA